ncbi:RND transporter [Verrucomicrobiota bacterium]|nr:RND transporter [Verrucomicrobiota bacterium]
MVALVGAGWWYWRGAPPAEVQYRVATVGRGALTQAVTATGQLNPVVNVQVGSQVSGIIEKIMVDFNSRVSSNQVIAQLDSATFRANANQAEGELANARASHELATINARRAQDLFRVRLIAQADADKAVADLHQAEAQVKIREAALEKAKVDLARATIYSPIDGVVISRNVDVGQTVAASFSTPTLFLIANDLAKMQIDAMVSEADVGGVELGQEVNFTVDAFPYRTFQGRVVQVRNAPTTVQNVVTYDCVIEVENKDLKLKPGMTANVSIVVAQRPDAVKIPNAAFRFRPAETADAKKSSDAGKGTNQIAGAGGRTREGGGGGTGGGGGGAGGAGGGRPPGVGGGRPAGAGRPGSQRTIYVLPASASRNEDGTMSGKPQPVQVKTGISDGAFTEVLDGVKEGDTIVTGQTASGADAAKAPAANPFGGGGMRRY